MKKFAAVLLAFAIFLISFPYTGTAENYLEGITATEGISFSRSLNVSADENGASLEIRQTALSSDEQTITFSASDIRLDEYEGIQLWFKNENSTAIRFRLSLNSSAAFLKSGLYYTVDKNELHSEKIFLSENTVAGEKTYATIPAQFEGWIYIPFNSLDLSAVMLPGWFLNELQLDIHSADFGLNRLYVDEIGGYNGNLPLYDFESTAGLSAGAGFARQCVASDFNDGKALELISSATTSAAVSLLTLDMRAGGTAGRDVSKYKGIRFWIKTTGGSQAADKNMYLYTAYDFPNHSHYPDWCTYSMPYYLVSADGTVTTKQRVLDKTYDLYQKGLCIPDGFEGWVYMPLNTDALWNGTVSKWVNQTNGLLNSLKITAGNTVGKTVYLDSLGFYTNLSVPEADCAATTFFSFCTETMDTERAGDVAQLINALLPYTADMEDCVASAKAAYEQLSLPQRNLIENYYVLSDAETLLSKLGKSKIKLDFEEENDLADIVRPDNTALALNKTDYCTGASSLSVSVTDETKDINTLRLKMNDSYDSLFSFELWIKTGDKKVEMTFQADCPGRCTIRTGSLYYLTGSNETTSYSVQEQKIGEYYQPYLTVPANFEGYINIPFTSLKSYSGETIDVGKTGLIYLGVIGGNQFNIDTVRGSFMIAQSGLTEREICEVWQSVSALRNEIASLTNVTADDAQRIQDIRRRFNGMPVNLQLLIDNVSVLADAEAALRALKPGKYLLDYEDKTLFDWTGLSSAICTTAFEYENALEGNISLHISATDSGEFMSVAFKKPSTDLTGYSGVEMRVKTGDKPAVFFIQADIPVRALLQTGASYFLTDLSGNITGYAVSGTNLGGNFGWCPLLTVPANFDGFLSFKCESFKCYDTAAAVDRTKMGNFYFVFTQATELTVDAVRLYKRVLEGLNLLGDDRTDEQRAQEFDAALSNLGAVTSGKQTQIAALRKTYMGFSEKCKALVTKLAQLEDAEQRLLQMLNAGVLFDFDGEDILWTCSDGAQAILGTENAAAGNALKLLYPKASSFIFSSVRRNFSDKKGIQFFVNSEATSIVSVQLDAPYRCYIGKEKMYYLVDLEGNILERETYLSGYISIPAGFIGTVQIPFESFSAYDTNTIFEAEKLGDIYLSFANGYGKYGKLYIDTVQAYK